MDQPDSEAHLLLDQHIREVEQRLTMLREQIVAMLDEDDGMGPQSELLFSTCKAMRCLKRLRSEMREAGIGPASSNGSG